MTLTFSSQSEAIAASLPVGTTSVIIGGRTYRKAAVNPRNASATLTAIVRVTIGPVRVA